MKKLNMYFFDEEQPMLSDMLTYYGMYIVTGIMVVSTLI